MLLGMFLVALFELFFEKCSVLFCTTFIFDIILLEAAGLLICAEAKTADEDE